MTCRPRSTSGAFREDLYFRLNVIRFSIPPLRERSEDVPLLVSYYIHNFSQSHKVPATRDHRQTRWTALIDYRWPGNIRELKNVVERIVLKAAGRAIKVADLPPEIVSTRPAVVPAIPSEPFDPTILGNGRADELATLMIKQGESFWSAVYPIFMSRDLTRIDLRRIIQIGLETTNGNYRLLVQLFNMQADDYKRFLELPPEARLPLAVSTISIGAGAADTGACGNPPKRIAPAALSGLRRLTDESIRIRLRRSRRGKARSVRSDCDLSTSAALPY